MKFLKKHQAVVSVTEHGTQRNKKGTNGQMIEFLMPKPWKLKAIWLRQMNRKLFVSPTERPHFTLHKVQSNGRVTHGTRQNIPLRGRHFATMKLRQDLGLYEVEL